MLGGELQTAFGDPGGEARESGQDGRDGKPGRERDPHHGGPCRAHAERRLLAWLGETAGLYGPFSVRSLAGGNSNETMLLSAGSESLIMRRPPRATIDSSAHNVAREERILAALVPTAVPAPEPRFLCTEEEVPEAPFLLMEAVNGVSLRDEVPGRWGDPGAAVTAIGEQTVDALAELHTLDWKACGLADFGRPEGFGERQVPRWRKQLDRYRHRDLPDFEPVATWLEGNRPPDGEPGILHGDFHVNNCLFAGESSPQLAAVIDWEMSTIGDPLLDVGLFLGFWGRERIEPHGMPVVQAISRVGGAPSREQLAARYERQSGRSLECLPYYMALAFWKLAAIVEGAHAHFVAGHTDAPYAAALEHDVPALLAEARAFSRL